MVGKSFINEESKFANHVSKYYQLNDKQQIEDHIMPQPLAMKLK
jgi:hypothetical protein